MVQRRRFRVADRLPGANFAVAHRTGAFSLPGDKEAGRPGGTGPPGQRHGKSGSKR